MIVPHVYREAKEIYIHWITYTYICVKYKQYISNIFHEKNRWNTSSCLRVHLSVIIIAIFGMIYKFTRFRRVFFESDDIRLSNLLRFGQ